jgi:hypothetical protein
MLGLLEAHERDEGAEIIPVIEVVDRPLAATLALAHAELEAAHHEVARAIRNVGLAAPAERALHGRELLRAINHLTAKYLVHLNHEETVVTAVLWGALGDRELVAIRNRILDGTARRCGDRDVVLEAARSEHPRAELSSDWRAILRPVIDAAEGALVFGGNDEVK